MPAMDQIKVMLERVTTTTRVETVYGEPREVAGKTVIPVARVMFCGGGGGGGGKAQEGQEGSGGGGGMGVGVHPIGMYVITADAERWVPVVDVTRAVLACSAVLITGLVTLRAIFGGRHRRRWEERWARHHGGRHRERAD